MYAIKSLKVLESKQVLENILENSEIKFLESCEFFIYFFLQYLFPKSQSLWVLNLDRLQKALFNKKYCWDYIVSFIFHFIRFGDDIQLAPKRQSFKQGCHVKSTVVAEKPPVDKSKRLTGRPANQRRNFETDYKDGDSISAGTREFERIRHKKDRNDYHSNGYSEDKPYHHERYTKQHIVSLQKIFFSNYLFIKNTFKSFCVIKTEKIYLLVCKLFQYVFLT